VQLVAKTVGLRKYGILDSEEMVAAIARHGIVKEDNGKLIRYLMKNAHWSPLDMINFTFEIETSRDIGRHLLRHNPKKQEHSTRYSDRVMFEPIEIRKEHPTNRQSSTEVFDPEFSFSGYDKVLASELIDDALEYLEQVYFKLLEQGVAKECARKILPGCLTTTITMNGTLRDWLSFLNVRCDNHSEKETQQIATLIGEELEKQMPNLFSEIDWRKGMFM